MIKWAEMRQYVVCHEEQIFVLVFLAKAGLDESKKTIRILTGFVSTIINDGLLYVAAYCGYCSPSTCKRSSTGSRRSRPTWRTRQRGRPTAVLRMRGTHRADRLLGKARRMARTERMGSPRPERPLHTSQAFTPQWNTPSASTPQSPRPALRKVLGAHLCMALGSI